MLLKVSAPLPGTLTSPSPRCVQHSPAPRGVVSPTYPAAVQPQSARRATSVQRAALLPQSRTVARSHTPVSAPTTGASVEGRAERVVVWRAPLRPPKSGTQDEVNRSGSPRPILLQRSSSSTSIPRVAQLQVSQARKQSEPSRGQKLGSQPPHRPESADEDDDFLEDGSITEPWLLPGAVSDRCRRLGLDQASVASFAQSNEFISLGNFCAVARALQALGLKRCTYPFDWMRNTVKGTLHCLKTNFAEFFNCGQPQEVTHPSGEKFEVVPAHWGGSFWHHDPSSPKTRQDLQRRIQRFKGEGEVPPERARVFVWAVNSTDEVNDAFTLYIALRRMFLRGTLRLLVLIDLQLDTGLISLTDSTSQVLFCKVPASLWEKKNAPWTMEKQACAYAEAIAKAVHAWSGNSESLKQVPSLGALINACIQFSGGDVTRENFFPRQKLQRRSQARAISPTLGAPPDPAGIAKNVTGSTRMAVASARSAMNNQGLEEERSLRRVHVARMISVANSAALAPAAPADVQVRTAPTEIPVR
mmetsp:Transcript_67486/g.161954  ORF Transcript_67486/g.161954 Transcript_67486/m.161954 type:complete len:530 (-) Transcript_67486:90-1679(-)